MTAMTSDDQYIAMFVTLVWPVRAAFDTCPVSSALWCIALGGGPPHPDDLELAARSGVARARPM